MGAGTGRLSLSTPSITCETYAIILDSLSLDGYGCCIDTTKYIYIHLKLGHFIDCIIPPILVSHVLLRCTYIPFCIPGVPGISSGGGAVIHLIYVFLDGYGPCIGTTEYLYRYLKLAYFMRCVIPLLLKSLSCYAVFTCRYNTADVKNPNSHCLGKKDADTSQTSQNARLGRPQLTR